ncbi:MAG TPA: hypothetical protein P5543_07350 [Planctomycetota bacterium]|nr:hypothetical protein [Planctomycetota bacterium]HRU51989.1 hypothetical protein [Planctomycetota bacterium]
MKFILFFLISILVCGCMNLNYDCPTDFQSTEQAPEERIAILESKIQDGTAIFETHYELAGLYTLTNQMDKALIQHKQVLQINPNHHETYVSMKNILRIQSTELRDKMLHIGQAKENAKVHGNADIKNIMQQWDNAIKEKIKLSLIEADFYLLYNDILSNIAEFPEIEAHIRDVQDLWKERWEAKQTTLHDKEEINDPLYMELQNRRSALAIKHAKTLLAMSIEYEQKGNVNRAIDMLRDAEAQIAKFYPEEEPTAEMVILTTEENVDYLSRNILDALYRNYEKELEIETRNRDNLQSISEYQESMDAQKQMEQTLENMIQLRFLLLWRYEKIGKADAELHETMIPLYERLIQLSKDSLKAGEYHYRLAEYHHEKRNKQKALYHAKEAEQILGAYRVKFLLESIQK